MIEDVTLVKQREITAAVRFRGGATTRRARPRPLTAPQMRVTHARKRDRLESGRAQAVGDLAAELVVIFEEEARRARLVLRAACLRAAADRPAARNA